MTIRPTKMALTICLAGTLALAGCATSTQSSPGSQSSISSTYAVAQPVIPEKIAEDNSEAWLKVMDENPLDEAFLSSLSAFSYRTAAAVLSQDTEGAAVQDAKNATYSPVSLYFALAMATQGASGDTAQQMNALLGAPDAGTVPQECGNLFRVLASDPYTTMQLANSLWMSDRDTFEQGFIDTATQQFYATPFSVSFGTPEADAALADWIALNTNDALKPEIQTSANQLLALINTVYFKNGWASPFDIQNTLDDTFHTTTGDTTASFMTQHFDNPREYEQTALYTRASLDFAGGATMTFVLPAEGTTPANLLANETLLKEAFTSTSSTLARINFTLPKTTFDSSFDLIEPLKQLGMTIPFSDQANFSNLTSTPAFISSVEQESHISWDENGAEASAYTNIGISKMSLMPENVPEVDFKLNRPFLFAITSAQGVPLFIGVCENPVA
ncbi:MAG: serpin family protein [Gordonibacter sp.]|nr:serpin family protein [Gordonibacter sp.]